MKEAGEARQKEAALTDVLGGGGVAVGVTG
jgi:hypothetical protein